MAKKKLNLVGGKGERDIVLDAIPNHRSIRSRSVIDFIVDTGSQITILSEITRQRLQIKKKGLSYKESFSGAAGGKKNAAKLNDVEFMIKDDVGNVHKLKQDVLIPQGGRFDIIGLDFLEKQNINLHCTSNDENSLDAHLEI